jgi:hypothetical protein
LGQPYSQIEGYAGKAKMGKQSSLLGSPSVMKDKSFITLITDGPGVMKAM